MVNVAASILLASAATASAAISRRATDGPDPKGTVLPNTIKDCTYWINAETGDTCASVQSTYGISNDAFIQYNPSGCPLKVGYSYCIEENYGQGPAPGGPTTTTPPPTTMKTTTSPPATTTTDDGHSPVQSGIVSNCNRYYKVQQGDGCQAIVDMYGTFSLDDFYKWNPSVHTDCSGLQYGYYVCVGIPGTPTTRPTTTHGNGPEPTQSGIISSCTKYYQAVSGDSCTIIADRAGTFTVDQFIQWNPAVKSDCSGLLAGDYYCVAIPGTPTSKPTNAGPSPTQSGITKSCTKYYKAVSGDSCTTIVNNFGEFSLDQFVSWNPAVKSDCSGLIAGDYYCVAVPGTPTTRTAAAPAPGPTQPGITSNCNKYAAGQSGDTCSTFASRNHISLQNLYNWNTVLGNNGQNCQTKFWANEYYCIGVR